MNAPSGDTWTSKRSPGFAAGKTTRFRESAVVVMRGNIPRGRRFSSLIGWILPTAKEPGQICVVTGKIRERTSSRLNFLRRNRLSRNKLPGTRKKIIWQGRTEWAMFQAMKTIMLGLIVLGLAGTALAIDRTELDHRVRTLMVKLEDMQIKPDKMIPSETLRKARGIILLDRTKAGFIFAFQGGNGIAMVRDPKTEKWGPVAFLAANEGSLGFQVGGEKAFYVILLMNTNATRILSDPNFEFGGEARGTAGAASAGAEGKVSAHEASVLVYSDRKGLFGGVSLKAGSIAPDDDANHVYYGEYLSMNDILFDGKAKPTATSNELAKRISDFSKSSDLSNNSAN
jgi:lipid-binding SYLF domain-containing protein